MSEQLRVDRAVVERDAAQISGAAGYFGGAGLPSTDSRTTLSANPKSQGAFARGQSGLATLGGVLDADVGNIRSLGVSFEEFDIMMGEIARLEPTEPVKELTVNGNSID